MNIKGTSSIQMHYVNKHKLGLVNYTNQCKCKATGIIYEEVQETVKRLTCFPCICPVPWLSSHLNLYSANFQEFYLILSNT